MILSRQPAGRCMLHPTTSSLPLLAAGFCANKIFGRGRRGNSLYFRCMQPCGAIIRDLSDGQNWQGIHCHGRSARRVVVVGPRRIGFHGHVHIDICLHPDACIVSCLFFSIGFLPYGTSDKRTESLDDYLAGECTIHKISSYIRYLPVYLDTHVGTGTD